MSTHEPRAHMSPGVNRFPSRTCASFAGRPGSLIQSVQTAAGAVDRRTLRSAASEDFATASQATKLLRLLAYCYARQIYSSTDVEALMRRDAKLQSSGQDQCPDAQRIRQFRRENREALLVCLEAALRFLAEEKVAEGFVTRVNEASLAEEARRRVVMAMFVDSMEQDKEHCADAPIDLCYLFAKGHTAGH